MIQPDEIKKKVLRWWKPLLQAHINGETFFPRTLDRIGKIQPRAAVSEFESLQKQTELLYRHSKAQRGKGYEVKTIRRRFRRMGEQEIPDHILFATTADYLAFTGKKKEWETFLSNYNVITATLPALRPWILDNCLWLTDPRLPWETLLLVCGYFIATPRPGLYLRQLPLEIHTKFIEQHEAVLQSMLNFLLPDDIRNSGSKRFAERFYLRYDEPLIRIRTLDPGLPYAGNLTDISIPLSDFAQQDPAAQHVLITENKMNFLTLPQLPDTIAVWSGGGFNIACLKDIAWLAHKRILYWGDMDEHGFQILNQLRKYYPTVRSIMMDKRTFDRYRAYAVDGTRSTVTQLERLYPEENELYNYLKTLTQRNRLEQEKLPQAFVEQQLKNDYGIDGVNSLSLKT